MGHVVGRYLAAQADRPASTTSVHRWALGGLAETWGDEPLGSVLRDGGVVRWLTSPTGSGREPSPATVRQRAAAVRALLGFAVEHRMLDAGTADAAGPTLRRPATPPVQRPPEPATLLLERLAGSRPYGVSRDVWVRFRAHVRLLAATGAPERDLGRACVADVADDRASLQVAGVRHLLDDPTRHALAAWLPVRAGLVATLQGSPPAHLWVRVHPSVHPRTGAVAAVGMPITARGLRKAFTDVVAALAAADPRVAACTVGHLRTLAAGAPPTPRDVGHGPEENA